MRRSKIRQLLEQARASSDWRVHNSVQCELDRGIVGRIRNEAGDKKSARVNAVFLDFVKSGEPVDGDWVEALYKPKVVLDSEGGYVDVPIERRGRR